MYEERKGTRWKLSGHHRFGDGSAASFQACNGKKSDAHVVLVWVRLRKGIVHSMDPHDPSFTKPAEAGEISTIAKQDLPRKPKAQPKKKKKAPSIGTVPALKQASVNANAIEMMSLPSKMQEEMVSQFPCYICNGTGQFVKGIETTYGFAAGQEAKIELEYIEAQRSKQKKDQRKRFVQSTSFFQQGPIGEDVVAYDAADWDSGACVLVIWFRLYDRGRFVLRFVALSSSSSLLAILHTHNFSFHFSFIRRRSVNPKITNQKNQMLGVLWHWDVKWEQGINHGKVKTGFHDRTRSHSHNGRNKGSQSRNRNGKPSQAMARRSRLA